MPQRIRIQRHHIRHEEDTTAQEAQLASAQIGQAALKTVQADVNNLLGQIDTVLNDNGADDADDEQRAA